MTNQAPRASGGWKTIAGALLLFAIGGLFFLAGILDIVSGYRYKSGATVVVAEVIANVENCPNKGECAWQPTFAFTDQSGGVVHRESGFANPDYDYAVGDVVTVHVNPDYDSVRIPGEGNIWVFGIAISVLGALPFFLGIWLFRMRPRS